MVCFQTGRLRLIIDCVKKWRTLQKNWTKTDGRQARDTKYTLCGRPEGVRYQIRTTVDFSVPLAVSLFLSSHNCTAPFFDENYLNAESTAIVHLWFPCGKRNRTNAFHGEINVKKWREGTKRLRKILGLCCRASGKCI